MKTYDITKDQAKDILHSLHNGESYILNVSNRTSIESEHGSIDIYDEGYSIFPNEETHTYDHSLFFKKMDLEVIEGFRDGTFHIQINFVTISDEEGYVQTGCGCRCLDERDTNGCFASFKTFAQTLNSDFFIDLVFASDKFQKVLWDNLEHARAA